MNIVFMGTPDFAVESLSKLYDSGHNILAVVSQPDRPSGRGMKLKPTPVKEYALSKNIPIYQVEKVRKNEEFINQIKSLKPDVIVVVAFGQILELRKQQKLFVDCFSFLVQLVYILLLRTKNRLDKPLCTVHN